MHETARSLGPLLAMVGLASALQAQDLPTSQPKFLNIVIEKVKIGRAAEHARHEAGWPSAYEKAKSSQAYVALSSLTGSPEVWYLTPFESHAALGESTQREEGDPVLSAELERLQKADADYLTDIQMLQAAARPDLSHGAFPDVSKVRFYEISVFHVKPGHAADFATVAKGYASAAAKAAPKVSWRTYEVMAGAPSGMYLVLSSYENFGELDQSMGDFERIVKSFTADQIVANQKFDAEALERPVVTNRYRLDPQQSYVARAVREKDPAFWMPKPVGNAKVAAKKPARP